MGRLVPSPMSRFGSCTTRGSVLTGLAGRELAQGVGDAFAVSRVRLRAVGDMSVLDMLGGLADVAGRVVEQDLLLLRIHLPEQIAGLLPVIVIHPMIPVGGGAFDLERRLVELRLVGPLAQAMGK